MPFIATDLAQAEYDKASEEERQVQDTIREIERKLDIDLGDDETFAQLLDQCFEFKDIEYVRGSMLVENRGV